MSYLANPSTRPRPSRIATGVRYALGYVVLIWAVFFINLFVFGGTLNALGIHPLDPSAWWHIFVSPLLHANLEHLISNSAPGAIFCFLIGLSGRRAFWEVTFISLIIGGIGVWLFGGVGTNHIGASGLIYGWLAYLVIRGIFNRSFSQILLGVILGFCYSGLVWGVLPGVPGISWQAHLFGGIGGALAGMVIRSDDPPALQARRQQRLPSSMEQ
ncbi:rhomboid family intramembrane serine protease [Corynebacterium poyangense]|uniref:Rhomboid family intramembrane serine protease n=1 Tax=Corynebacterium poyangense TaxID=2684405 RepID=A0A7H0SQS3_9CORY|nr:rhomboid family intramembrane serine protease [Corynebacterium poyangense]MBZ8178224.1 rhomboid family intramembrane serine protease [Corynebacterium poyangense]QNQ90898.1 rhomboid family intramembrane serine protease [Corynebacterium poyangense]